MAYMNHQKTHQTNPMAPWNPLDAPLRILGICQSILRSDGNMVYCEIVAYWVLNVQDSSNFCFPSILRLDGTCNSSPPEAPRSVEEEL